MHVIMHARMVCQIVTNSSMSNKYALSLFPYLSFQVVYGTPILLQVNKYSYMIQK